MCLNLLVLGVSVSTATAITRLSEAIALTIIIAAQPFLSIKEYTPYSTRGGNAVNIGHEQKTSEKAKGVSFNYATNWSLSPKEIATFFIPRFLVEFPAKNIQEKNILV